MGFPLSSVRPKGLTRSVPPFNPATLSPSLWLDPSDLSTLFQNSGGTGAVSSDGDPVGYIADKSGNAKHFTQSTAGARPLYKASGGLKWLSFDGTDDFLTLGAAISNIITNSTYDIVVAGMMEVITTNDGSAYESNDAMYSDLNNGVFGLHFKTGTPQMVAYNYDGSYDVAADSYTAGTAFVAHVRHSGGNLSLTLNANSTVTVASGNTQSVTGNFLIGRNGFSIYSQCRLYGMIARKTVLDATELANAKAYLRAKAGL